MKVTRKNVHRVCADLATMMVDDSLLRERFNDWLDRLLDEDVFGTEGQLDPRGDPR